jgi:hypothetical protein
VLAVWAFAGNDERLAFFDLLAESLALDGQLLDPFGYLADVLTWSQD